MNTVLLPLLCKTPRCQARKLYWKVHRCKSMTQQLLLMGAVPALESCQYCREGWIRHRMKGGRTGRCPGPSPGILANACFHSRPRSCCRVLHLCCSADPCETWCCLQSHSGLLSKAQRVVDAISHSALFSVSRPGPKWLMQHSKQDATSKSPNVQVQLCTALVMQAGKHAFHHRMGQDRCNASWCLCRQCKGMQMSLQNKKVWVRQ